MEKILFGIFQIHLTKYVCCSFRENIQHITMQRNLMQKVCFTSVKTFDLSLSTIRPSSHLNDTEVFCFSNMLL